LQAFGVLSSGGYCVLRGTRTVPAGTALDSKPG
jgi:hypothetical protein